jgi:uncharacterized protein (DUF1499 family)
MMFMGHSRVPPLLQSAVATTTTTKAQPVATASLSPPPPSNNMVWGKPTWYVLHTLAHKVKPELFQQIRRELLEVVTRICTNLPCPMCSNHASEYLRKINYDAIQTPQDLKMLLFQFHNSVNSRKSAPLFHYSELDSTYDVAITVNMIQNFMIVFQQSHNNGAQININTFSKNRTIQHLQTWFREYLQCFHP